MITRAAPLPPQSGPWPSYRGPFEVIEARTGKVLWTISVKASHQILAHESLTWIFPGMPEAALWGSHPDSYLYFEYWEVDGERSYVTDSLVAWLEGRGPSNLRAWRLDLETGESQPITRAEWMGDLDQRTLNACVAVLPSWTCTVLLREHHVRRSSMQSVALIELDQLVSLPASLFSQPCRLPGAC